MLRERLTDLLTDPSTGRVHARLEPVFQALLDSRRPQTTIGWLRRPPGHGPRLLGLMARREIEISHDTFRRLPSDRAHNYLRGLLAAAGVLEPYDDHLERITPWLQGILQGLPKQHADILSQYANWHVLRYLRRHAATPPTVRSAARWCWAGAPASTPPSASWPGPPSGAPRWQT
jgi:hypothetical protein